ncbi:hypothetical protein NP233_g69 [Leucocoprinus birnbaumii]|uniref:Uncharacterized protein n=1 Tax=Leucocoprinus birnbaumii TaxID=56174 RepID=A0AAD5YW47_9AGAR|nr:hypothetical protein NP233_g69 [Leucocoprinus birnbaumii]
MRQKRDDDLAKIHDRVLAARYASTRDFEKRNANRIRDYDFGAAFRLIPYHPRSRKRLEVTEFADPKDLGGVENEDLAEESGDREVDEGN